MSVVFGASKKIAMVRINFSFFCVAGENETYKIQTAYSARGLFKPLILTIFCSK